MHASVLLIIFLCPTSVARLSFSCFPRTALLAIFLQFFTRCCMLLTSASIALISPLTTLLYYYVSKHLLSLSCSACLGVTLFILHSANLIVDSFLTSLSHFHTLDFNVEVIEFNTEVTFASQTNAIQSSQLTSCHVTSCHGSAPKCDHLRALLKY